MLSWALHNWTMPEIIANLLDIEPSSFLVLYNQPVSSLTFLLEFYYYWMRCKKEWQGLSPFQLKHQNWSFREEGSQTESIDFSELRTWNSANDIFCVSKITKYLVRNLNILGTFPASVFVCFNKICPIRQNSLKNLSEWNMDIYRVRCPYFCYSILDTQAIFKIQKLS